MSHQDTYVHNEEYAEFLGNWDTHFYAKYADALKPSRPGARALDVGCGVGQVVARLVNLGYEAHGVDVSQPSIARAQKLAMHCHLYDGKRLPYPDARFNTAGALNVLEHVEEPEAMIQEIVRVVEPGGKIVLSSPNFMRVVGFRDYHTHMRGIRRKWRNWWRLRQKWREMLSAPDRVRFDRMVPIFKQPFEPDDDAIIATNGLEMAFFLRRKRLRHRGGRLHGPVCFQAARLSAQRYTAALRDAQQFRSSAKKVTCLGARRETAATS